MSVIKDIISFIWEKVGEKGFFSAISFYRNLKNNLSKTKIIYVKFKGTGDSEVFYESIIREKLSKVSEKYSIKYVSLENKEKEEIKNFIESYDTNQINTIFIIRYDNQLKEVFGLLKQKQVSIILLAKSGEVPAEEYKEYTKYGKCDIVNSYSRLVSILVSMLIWECL